MVLEKILGSLRNNKEIKLVNLKGNQPVTTADSAETSTEGLQVQRMVASTEKVTNHGSSKQKVYSSTPGGSSERLKALCNLVPRYMCCILPKNIGGKEGAFWALEEV